MSSQSRRVFAEHARLERNTFVVRYRPRNGDVITSISPRRSLRCARRFGAVVARGEVPRARARASGSRTRVRGDRIAARRARRRARGGAVVEPPVALGRVARRPTRGDAGRGRRRGRGRVRGRARARARRQRAFPRGAPRGDARVVVLVLVVLVLVVRRCGPGRRRDRGRRPRLSHHRPRRGGAALHPPRFLPRLQPDPPRGAPRVRPTPPTSPTATRLEGVADVVPHPHPRIVWRRGVLAGTERSDPLDVIARERERMEANLANADVSNDFDDPWNVSLRDAEGSAPRTRRRSRPRRTASTSDAVNATLGVGSRALFALTLFFYVVSLALTTSRA